MVYQLVRLQCIGRDSLSNCSLSHAGDVELNKAMPAGTYAISWTLHAQPDPNCDPTQGPCENWGPGVYTAIVGEWVGSNVVIASSSLSPF